MFKSWQQDRFRDEQVLNFELRLDNGLNRLSNVQNEVFCNVDDVAERFRRQNVVEISRRVDAVWHRHRMQIDDCRRTGNKFCFRLLLS